MELTPPLISGYVKLTKFAQIRIDRAYESGFISLRTAEPSLGIPSSRTLTDGNAPYYFPIFGISDTYLGSRKYSGNDSIMMRNKNIGINNSNPQYSIDINGGLRAVNSIIPTLSTSFIVPSSNTNPVLNIKHTGGTYIENDLNVQGTTYVNNLTATNIVARNIQAQTTEFVNTLLTVLTLTGASIDTDVSVTGNLTATNVIATSSVTTPIVNTQLINTSELFTTNMTVVSTLSVGSDIYVNNIFGKIAIDPTSALIYNPNNQLTFSGLLNYTFVVHPTDKFSTDDFNTVRSPRGEYDVVNYYTPPGVDPLPGVYRPFFKSIQGVLDYVERSGLFGNQLSIRVFGDVVNNERRPTGLGSITPEDESGNYSSLKTVTGNLTSAFYSTEWLGANYPALTAAGIKGGEFVWSLDGNNPFGQIYGIVLPNLNFNTIFIRGNQNIGRFNNRNTPKNIDVALLAGSGIEQTPFYNINNDARDFYWDHKICDMPPCNISQRVYVWGGNPLSGFGTFGEDPNLWLDLKTNNFITYYPVYLETPTTLAFIFRDLSFEFDSNTYINRGFFVESGYLSLVSSTIAMLGTSMYLDGALSLHSSNTRLHIATNYSSVDPFFLFIWDVTSSATGVNRVLGIQDAAQIRDNLQVLRPDGQQYDSRNIFPHYGLAIIGNPPGKQPTLVWNETNKQCGLITLRNGAQARVLTFATNQRTYGFLGNHGSMVILGGQFNAPSLYHVNNNVMLMNTQWVFRTDNFALSAKNVRFNNTGEDPTNRLEFFNSTDPKERFNFQYLQFEGGFTNYQMNSDSLRVLRPWAFAQIETTPDAQYSSFISINNNADEPGYTFATTNLVDLSGSLFSLGSFNQIKGDNNIFGNRFLRTIQPQQLKRIGEFGYGFVIDPIGGNSAPYEMDFYAPSLR